MSDDPVVARAAELAGEPDGFERLWTPHRMAYIGGENKPADGAPGDGCPFCRAATLPDDGIVTWDLRISQGDRTVTRSLSLYVGIAPKLTYLQIPLAVLANAPFPVTTSGATVTGGQSVDAFQTVDLHVGYKFETEGMLADTSVFADVSNLFDEDPPFSNQSGGYNGSDASPIGRVITLGISKKW